MIKLAFLFVTLPGFIVLWKLIPKGAVLFAKTVNELNSTPGPLQFFHHSNAALAALS